MVKNQDYLILPWFNKFIIYYVSICLALSKANNYDTSNDAKYTPIPPKNIYLIASYGVLGGLKKEFAYYYLGFFYYFYGLFLFVKSNPFQLLLLLYWGFWTFYFCFFIWSCKNPYHSYLSSSIFFYVFLYAFYRSAYCYDLEFNWDYCRFYDYCY